MDNQKTQLTIEINEVAMAAINLLVATGNKSDGNKPTVSDVVEVAVMRYVVNIFSSVERESKLGGFMDMLLKLTEDDEDGEDGED